MISKRPEAEHYDVASGLPDSGYYRVRLRVHTIALGPDNLADRMMFHLPPHTRLHMATADNDTHEAFIDVDVYGLSPVDSLGHVWTAVVNLGTALRMEQKLEPWVHPPRLIDANIVPASDGS